MLQAPQGQIGSSGDAAASAQPPQQPAQAQGSVGVESGGGFSEEETGGRIEGERSSGGTGWPRQETLALINIRSEMDSAFRDASAKAPLWDEVSRKLGELGYHRSGKKCKEKFENVYKYHKRTKEGRTSKADGKTYRFFDQLEALESNNPRPPPLLAGMTTTATTTTTATATHPFPQPSVVIPFNITGSHSHQTNVSPISVAAPATVNHAGAFPFSFSNSTSSSTSSDEDAPELRKKRKRKWKNFFGKLMTEVIHKQEELQMKFLDQIERRERDRIAREEAWRMEEMAKMNREHDLLVQERSIAAAKDAAVITFLQKISEQNPNILPQISPLQQKQQNSVNLQPQPQPQPPPPPTPVTPQQHQVQLPGIPAAPVVKSVDNGGGGNSSFLTPSPSRWPKTEVNALIKLRTTLDMKYQDSGPKGPLWEEISSGMMKLGYNRNAKRCKEKWENINKYYKKVKESSKKRPEDSKTCPYFHQLDAIYRERANNSSYSNSSLRLPETTTQMEPIMAEPEQQWPLPAVVVQQQQQQQQQQDTVHRNQENVNQSNEDDYDDEDEDEEEEDEGGDFEVVANNNSSTVATVKMTET